MTYTRQPHSLAAIAAAVNTNTKTLTSQAVKKNNTELQELMCSLNNIHNSLGILYKNLRKINAILICNMKEKEKKSEN